MTRIPDGVPEDAVDWAADAVAHLVSSEEGGVVAALDSLQCLVDASSHGVALIVVAQLCAGVVLGCADLLDVDPVRMVRDTAAAIAEADEGR